MRPYDRKTIQRYQNWGGEQLAQDKEPMSETEMLEFMAGRTEYSYPATRYRTMHPDEVDPSDIASMDDMEFNDFLVALNMIEDYRTIPRSARPLSQL